MPVGRDAFGERPLRRDLPPSRAVALAIYPAARAGRVPPVNDDRRSPTFALPAGSYVVHVGSSASATKAVQFFRRAAARGVRDIRRRRHRRQGWRCVPHGQIRPICTKAAARAPATAPDRRRRPGCDPGAGRHLSIVSNYGDGNSVVPTSADRKFTDAGHPSRRACSSASWGRARANTQWSVLTPAVTITTDRRLPRVTAVANTAPSPQRRQDLDRPSGWSPGRWRSRSSARERKARRS